MLDKSTYPFIVNTLESNNHWSLVVTKNAGGDWAAILDYNDGEDFTVDWGASIPEALGRLESVLAGREYIEPSATTDPEHEAYLARWKDAPEGAGKLQQFSDGTCVWTGGRWFKYAGENLLGSVRCEPKPELKATGGVE